MPSLLDTTNGTYLICRCWKQGEVLENQTKIKMNNYHHSFTDQIIVQLNYLNVYTYCWYLRVGKARPIRRGRAFVKVKPPDCERKYIVFTSLEGHRTTLYAAPNDKTR